MDPAHLILLFGVGALVGGAIIGAIVYRNLTPSAREVDDLKAELDNARREMETYQTSVNSHFDKTSELVNELTHDYVKVYRHLAEGAQSLGHGKDFANLLKQHQGEVLISVNDEATVPEAVVDEVVDSPLAGEPAAESSAAFDPAVAGETLADNDAADVAKPEATEVTQPDDKQEPVLDSEKSGSKHDDRVARAEAMAGGG